MSEREDTSNLNRREQRALQRLGRNKVIRASLKESSDVIAKAQPVVLRSFDDLAEENGDVDFYSQELDTSQLALRNLQLGHQFMRVLRTTGVSKETIRSHAVNMSTGSFDGRSFLADLTREADPRKLRSSINVINSLYQQTDKTRKFLADDAQVWVELMKDRDIPLDDLYLEAICARQETVGLLRLQIEWLQQHDAEDIPAQGENRDELHPPPPVDIMPPPSVTPFPLQDWKLHWTTRRWSTEPQYLVRIPTNSRDEALAHIKSTLFGEIMIKPVSVLNALEFYLRQDVLQRAMASRLKYVPEYMRDWIKIKRGRDRMLLLVPEEGRAIFFAGNRDEIYRNI